MQRTCTVVGAGSWGTALAVHLASLGHEVLLWDRDAARCEQMQNGRHNPRYLSEIRLSDNLRAVHDLPSSLYEADLIVTAVPSHALRDVMSRASSAVRADTLIACATKGIEEGTLRSMHDVLIDVLPDPVRDQVTVLSGPTFALELAKGLPAAAVVAGREEEAAKSVADAFHGGAFRCYHTDDTVGVCLGGSLKNVIAIAAGVLDGQEMGMNARAGMITRGLAEITRLAVACGADPRTMMGLAGLGDLVLTCTGGLSRNRRVGLALARGESLSDILDNLGEVAEGVRTTRSAYELATSRAVEMPITTQMYRVLYEGQQLDMAVADLLGRSRRHELD